MSQVSDGTVLNNKQAGWRGLQETLDKYLALAEKAAVLAGDHLANNREDALIDSLFQRDVKTSADRESERLIVEVLMSYSDITILSEEQGVVVSSADTSNDVRWIVDPLDGSLNYIRGIPICCVSIGMIAGNKPLLGAVYDFNRKELFTGIAEAGAWLNGNSIKVSDKKDECAAVLLTGFPASTDYAAQALRDYVDQVRSFKKVRLLGSAALSLAYVAAGKADAYFERDIMLWDVAAGLAILLGAGGEYSIRTTNESNAVEVMATNGSLQGVWGKRSTGNH